MFPLRWYEVSRLQTIKNPSTETKFGLSNTPQNGSEWSLFFLDFECIWWQWMSHLCDHSSVGENTLRACHWPIWLDIHDASFLWFILLFKERTACFDYNLEEILMAETFIWRFLTHTSLKKEQLQEILFLEELCLHFSFHFQKRF